MFIKKIIYVLQCTKFSPKKLSATQPAADGRILKNLDVLSFN